MQHEARLLVVRSLFLSGLIVYIAQADIGFASLAATFLLGLAAAAILISFLTSRAKADTRHKTPLDREPKLVHIQTDWRSSWIWNSLASGALMGASILLVLGVV